MKKMTNNQAPMVHRGKQQWKSIMQAYEQSGLTQESFCHQESIAPSTFYNWRKRLSVAKPAEPKEPMFIELPSPDISSKPSQWDIELVVGDNVLLRMRAPN